MRDNGRLGIRDTLEPDVVTAPTGPLLIPPSGDSTTALSLIVPTFNEAENIGPVLIALREALEPALPGRYEIIVVDDDSPDQTWKIALQAHPRLPALRVIRRRDERGLATGVMRGYQIARGELLGTINADFQHPPEILPRMLALMPGADVVVASRYIEGGGLGDWAMSRRVGSQAAAMLGRVLLPQVFRRTSDPLSGCYLFRRAAAAGVEFRPRGYKSLMEIMALGRVRTVRDYPYQMRERRLGRSKAGVRHSYEYLFHLLRLRALIRTAGVE